MDENLNKEDNQTPKRPALWRRILAKMRHVFEQIRSKNPKLFDGIAITIQAVWTIFTTFWVSALSKSTIAAAIVTLMTFGMLYLAQWALLTNRREREVAEEKKIAKVQREHLERKISVEALIATERSLEMMDFAHMVAHEIKMNISRMPNQSIEVTRYDIPEFLVETLNALEKILSDYYGQKICASIKLCNTQNTLKTVARGDNNISCRGGIEKAEALNKLSIKIKQNYAYDLILKRKIQYFAEGDLRALSEKEKGDDKFYCEYEDKWPELFLATIIIPIRCRILSEDTEEYKMLGLICIDSKEPQPDWNQKMNNYAYQTTAFVADALYGLIDSYIMAQTKRERIAK